MIRFVLTIQQKHIHLGKLNFLQELFKLFKKKPINSFNIKLWHI